MGPPQIINMHFHPSERAMACWLRQEIRKDLSFEPFMRATGGWCSKPLLCADGSSLTWYARCPRPAAAQAAGLLMPALSSAAAIFSCCVLETAFAGAGVDRRMTAGSGACDPGTGRCRSDPPGKLPVEPT